jgi:carboxymethylenebutenolidase
VYEERVTIDAPTGPLVAHLATPEGWTAGPAVIVIQEWWGLNPNIESFCQRFADEGFAAIAPDLYRGELTTEPDEAKKLMMRLDRPRAVEDLRAGISMLMDRGATKVGAMGFCMGGYLTHELALSDGRLGAAVACYGLTDPKDRELLAPMQVHIGDEDDFDPADMRALAATLASRDDGSELFTYEGAPHAFMNDTRPEVYRPEAAALAWERATAFLHAKLG